MPNQYEQLMKAVAERHSRDQRAEPWKMSVDVSTPAPVEEWISISEAADDSESDSEMIDLDGRPRTRVVAIGGVG
ncbi:hypothetical protein NPX13_g779 [Xylaria arbuscula]|uniref:Uncharacterized protein n=1 Tax=Xylaria arbuscula TaxID=114810 RepID=A0A9W8NNC0_9PEZI|nr:hypothetical protein NPX13_g779 [Xylaria arbuscula]